MNTSQTASGLNLINARAAKTALDSYKAHQANISVLLKALHDELAMHNQRAVQQPRNWGFAGDLGAVQERLEEVVVMLGGVK